jgi:hypothetical protein
MKIDFKGFTLHATTRQIVQTWPRPFFLIMPTLGRNFGNPLGIARRGRWRSFFNKHHNLNNFGY